MGERPTKPGWYNDPEGVHAHQAYWDGEKWTGVTRSSPPAPMWMTAVPAVVGLVALPVVWAAIEVYLFGNLTSVAYLDRQFLAGLAAVIIVVSAVVATIRTLKRRHRDTHVPSR